MNDIKTETMTPHGEHQPIVMTPNDRAVVTDRDETTDHDPIVVSPNMQTVVHGTSINFQLSLPIAATQGTTVTAFVIASTVGNDGTASYSFSNSAQTPAVGSRSVAFSLTFSTAGTCYVAFTASYGNGDATIPGGALITVT